MKTQPYILVAETGGGDDIYILSQGRMTTAQANANNKALESYYGHVGDPTWWSLTKVNRYLKRGNYIANEADSDRIASAK